LRQLVAGGPRVVLVGESQTRKPPERSNLSCGEIREARDTNERRAQPMFFVETGVGVRSREQKKDTDKRRKIWYNSGATKPPGLLNKK